MKFLVFLLAIIAARSAVVYPLTDSEMPELKVIDFITGFFEGLNEKGDINKLLECLHGVEKIIDKVIEGLELIITLKPDKVIQGMRMIVEAVKELLVKIKPCSEGFQQILKLLEAFKNIDIIKIAFRFIANPDFYIKEIRKAIEAFKNKDFYQAGKSVGTFLYKLFLAKAASPEDDVDVMTAIIESLKGFLRTFNKGKNVDEILICVNEFYGVSAYIKTAIEMIKAIDIKDVKTLFYAMISVVEAVKRVILALIPCHETKQNLKDIWELIKKIDMGERIQRIMMEFFNIMRHITNADQFFKEQKFDKFGEELGHVFFLILLKP